MPYAGSSSSTSTSSPVDGDHGAVLVAVRAQLHRDVGPLESRGRSAAPARLDPGQPVHREPLARTDGDRARDRLDVEDEPRLAVRRGPTEPEPLALADREPVGAVVLPELLAGLVEDRAALVGGALAELLAQPAGGVAVRDEADVVAVRLVRDQQAALGGLHAHVRLGRAAEREHRVPQLLLVEHAEHVGLVLAVVDGAVHLDATRRRPSAAGRSGRSRPPRSRARAPGRAPPRT